VIGLFALLLAGCAPEGPSPAAAALSPWPDEAGAVLARCAAEPFPELAITCKVQAAALYAHRGEEGPAAAICAGMAAGTWQDECHFRVGEELGRAGQLLVALSHCAKAGNFARYCITHAAWNSPPAPGPRPTDPVEAIVAAADELRSGVDQALAGAGDGLSGEGRDVFLARFGLQLYLGSGSAHPAAARLPDPYGVIFRTGFAVEAARLLPEPSVEQIAAIYLGKAPPPAGEPAPSPPIGRYKPPLLAPGVKGLPHTPTYGGGLRLVGETPEEDLLIAALEAMFWRADTDGAVFLPYLQAQSPRARWTALRLFTQAASTQVDTVALLTPLCQDPDPVLAWLAQNGVDHHPWEARPLHGDR
jgi:hypothetical protein